MICSVLIKLKEAHFNILWPVFCLNWFENISYDVFLLAQPAYEIHI